MRKIASPEELQSELRRLMAYCGGPEKPSRAKLATELNGLADRMAATSEAEVKLTVTFTHALDSGEKRIFLEAVREALTTYRNRFKGREKDVVDAFLDYDPYTEETKEASLRTARDSVLDYILDQNDLGDIYGKLMDEDEQSAELFKDVIDKLGAKLKLGSGEQEALSRVLDIVKRGKSWQIDLLRNNVFKAANALGIRLPSGMF